MYEYLHDYYYFDPDWFAHEFRVATAEEFLDHYKKVRPADVYRWLWEGEYGPGSNSPESSLDRLTYDLRLARMKQGAREQKIWEPMGLAMKVLKINLVPYADSGCPLKRLLDLSVRATEMRANTLRFKRDWNFMKTQIIPGMEISVDQMNSFENTIAFHMTPEVPWSELFLKQYGTGYRLAPRRLFFRHFPEYEPVDMEYMRLYDTEEEE